MINQAGDTNRKRKHRTIEMQEIVNLYFLETANIIPFQMAVRVQICSVLQGYGCYNRLQWIRFIFQCFFPQNTLTISDNCYFVLYTQYEVFI